MIHYWESSGELRQDMDTCVRLMVNAGCDPDTAPLLGGRHFVSPVEYVCVEAEEVRHLNLAMSMKEIQCGGS
jgi:hypothetical protein